MIFYLSDRGGAQQYENNTKNVIHISAGISKKIPDIKVITGIRRSGKSKLLDAFSALISKDDNTNVVRINLNQKKI